MGIKCWFDCSLINWALLFSRGNSTHYEEVFLLLTLELGISLLWTKVIEQPHKVRNLNVYSVCLVIDGLRVSTSQHCSYVLRFPTIYTSRKDGWTYMVYD